MGWFGKSLREYLFLLYEEFFIYSTLAGLFPPAVYWASAYQFSQCFPDVVFSYGRMCL